VPNVKKLPQDVINHWPEIFKEIDVEVIPIEYLHSVKIYFTDGKVWDIDVAKSRKQTDTDIETALEELFDQYEDNIENIDFRLDTDRVKKDIQSRTHKFMKKRK